MAGQYNAGNVKIAPHDAYYEAKETVCVSFAGMLPADLADTYFTIWGEDNIEYNVWFNLDGAGVAPAAAAGTLVEVAIATGDTAESMAATLAGLAVGNYTLSLDGLLVFFVNNTMLEVQNVASDNTSGLGVDVLTRGGNVFLGLIDGDISITPSTTTASVNSHQTGTTPLSLLIQGVEATVELTLLECTKSLYNDMIRLSGGSVFTPDGGTEVAGYGTGAVGTSAILSARTLRLHPVSLAADDYSCDWYFWKARPEVGGITISGENPQTLPLTFTAFPDTTKESAIDVFVYGDGSQSGL